jgi:Na+-transporting methylmalonyl-CoA/oxaloacetate decarboxylase gamma subunit
LTGFEAIAHHNGWMMAALGATIVFSGLAVLTFVISQLPRLFNLFEKKSDEAPSVPAPQKDQEAPEKKIEATPPLASTDPADIAKQIEPLVSMLQEPFQLSDLYRLCREYDLPHPHLSLSCLQRKGFLQSQGEGAFTWKPEGATAQEG